MLKNDLFQMYDNQYNKTICTICRQNNKNLSYPFSLWQIGESFTKNETQRILFVGKNARGQGRNNYHGIYDALKDGANYLENMPWPYWSYTKEICKKLYGNKLPQPWEKISFSNLVKCNNSDTIDTTSTNMKNNCILNLKIFLKELEILKPTHIIFYTGLDYDLYLTELFDIHIPNTTKKIGQKIMPWAEFTINIHEMNESIHCLRVGHPERKKKDNFVDAIVDWVNQT